MQSSIATFNQMETIRAEHGWSINTSVIEECLNVTGLLYNVQAGSLLFLSELLGSFPIIQNLPQIESKSMLNQ